MSYKLKETSILSWIIAKTTFKIKLKTKELFHKNKLRISLDNYLVLAIILLKKTLSTEI